MPRRRSEREHTDSSLRVERERADREYSARTATAAARTDRLVEAARARARRVLAEARVRSDELMAARGASASEVAEVAAERADADDAGRREDARADAVLASERAEVDRTLAALLAAERAETDGRLRAERAVADRALSGRGAFLGMVSHELGSTIQAVALYAAALRLKHASDADYAATAARLAPRIERAAVHMQRLVADLVDVASVQAGRFVVSREDRDLRRVAREALSLVEPLAKRKGVATELSLERGFRSPPFDRGRIVQVLTNLLGNAIKFTPAGGRVTMRLEREGDDGARVSVRDTGCGITPDQLDGIFDRNWQGNGHRADGAAAPGLGLGLYISRHIVEAHGGRLWAESEPGTGATFFFTLPPPRAAAAAAKTRRRS